MRNRRISEAWSAADESGGRLRGIVDALIAVPTDETPRIQECHILVGHALYDAVEEAVAAGHALAAAGVKKD